MLDQNVLHAFLEKIDSALAATANAGERLDLYLLGRSSLILRYGINLMTKDVDVVHEHNQPLLDRAEELFGRGTASAERLGFYLETVPSGLPPMPAGYQARAGELPGAWIVLRPRMLEPHDLATSKLSRFHAKDQEDLQILCDGGEIRAATLAERFDLAFLWTEDDAPQRVRAHANLLKVIDYLEGRTRTLQGA
jgi:hypothetical protein